MLQGVERFLKQSIVDRSTHVSSASLVSAIHLFSHASRDIVKRWVNEVQEAMSSSHPITQYHAMGLMFLIKQGDKMAISKLVQTLSGKGTLRGFMVQCMLVRYTARAYEDETSPEK